jgi:hypothetical protein
LLDDCCNTDTFTDATPVASEAVPQIPVPPEQPAAQPALLTKEPFAGNESAIVGGNVSTIQVKLVAELVLPLTVAVIENVCDPLPSELNVTDPVVFPEPLVPEQVFVVPSSVQAKVAFAALSLYAKVAEVAPVGFAGVEVNVGAAVPGAANTANAPQTPIARTASSATSVIRLALRDALRETVRAIKSLALPLLSVALSWTAC